MFNKLVRPVALASVAGIAALGSAAPAMAADPYSPGLPGSVGVFASYTLSEDVFDDDPAQGSPGDRHFDSSDAATGSQTAAVDSPGWPPVASFPGDVFCPGNCATADAVAAAQADATGVLQTYARGVAAVSSSEPSANAYALSRALIDDTITVSKATTVVLQGRVRATLHRTNSHRDLQSDPTGNLDVSLNFGGCYTENCPPPEETGFQKRYQPEVGAAEVVDETFEVHVALPAGTTPFNGELRSTVNPAVDGRPGENLSQVARIDAADNDDVERVEFTIVVPDDVAVSSGSGLLPIVGGQPPQEQDTTPPTLTVPERIVTDATGPGGATVGYSVAATDESGEPAVTCSPVSGSTFAIGDTTVACVARDAAGNETPKSFVVHVRGAAEQLAALRAKVEQLPARARRRLRPFVRQSCLAMRIFVRQTRRLERRGELSAAQAAELTADARRIAAVMGC
jgi:hypothetical protein